MENLRIKLYQLESNGDLTAENIDGLKSQYNHSIVCRAFLPGNCVTYALNLNDNELYKSITGSDTIKRAFYKPGRSNRNSFDIIPDTEFIDYCLTNEKLVEIDKNKCGSGDLVIYSANSSCQHIGKLKTKDVVISHWGDIALFEHEIYEVPASYGNSLIYVKPISEETAINHFVGYAKSVADEKCLPELISLV